MLHQRLSLTVAVLAGLGLRRVTAHGYCVKFAVGSETYAGFDPTWEGGPSVLGPTPQRPADNVNTEWADYTTAQIATGSEKTSEVGTQQLTAPAKAGDKVTIWYDQWPQPHSGPIMRYMALCPGSSCDGVPAGDLEWFKIDEEGYTNGQWPNDRLLPSNEWAQSFNLPTDLPGGNYLLANHMLAMHTVGEPQFYPVAFQIALESDGTVDPQPKGKFPDIYLSGPQDFVTWNIYEADNANMQLPGIPVYSGSATLANAGQKGVAGGGNTPTTSSAGGRSDRQAAPTATKTGGRVAGRPMQTTVANDEGRMSILPIGNGGPTLTTPPIMETDTPTVEPEDAEEPKVPADGQWGQAPDDTGFQSPVQTGKSRSPKDASGGRKSGAMTESNVRDPLEQFNGSPTVTVTVYAPAPTAETFDTSANIGEQTEQGTIDGPVANSWSVKQGADAPSQEVETEIEAETSDGEGDSTNAAMLGHESGNSAEQAAATRSQEETPTTYAGPDCSHASNNLKGESERKLRRSRSRQQPGYLKNARRHLL